MVKYLLEDYMYEFERFAKELLNQFKDANLMMIKAMDDVKAKNYVDKDDMMTLEFGKKYFEALVMMLEKYFYYMNLANGETKEEELEAIRQYIKEIASEIGL
jgi:hypothetical protein